jgi:parvulin-like peptidyl-prolyl isomerase
MKAVEHIPAAVPPLAEIKEPVTSAVKRQKAEKVALERAKQIAAEAKAGDVAPAAKKVGATSGDAAAFSRVKPAERLPGDAMHAALQTVAGRVTDPVKTPQGFYVMKVLERVPADLADLDKERDKLQRELTAQKQGQAWESWLASTRASAKIEMSTKLGPRRG